MAEYKNIESIRNKIMNNASGNKNTNSAWSAVSSNNTDIQKFELSKAVDVNFSGETLIEQSFIDQNLENSNFSVTDLTGCDFSGANLKGADLSGANLSDANFTGCDLSHASLNGAMIIRTNFTGAKLNGIKLHDAHLEDAILLGIEIDELGIEELQALIEYMIKYFPHKLNLSKINMTLLNLKELDLSKVSLRGVDLTGVDFTGVSLVGLNLSETNITPEQIAQALGRVPTPLELKQMMTPPVRNNHKEGKFGKEMIDLFIGDKSYGTFDMTRGTIGIDSILKLGKKVFRKSADKPPVKDENAVEYIKSEREIKVKAHNEELRKVIEERKKATLENLSVASKEPEKEVEREVERELPKESNKEVEKEVSVENSAAKTKGFNNSSISEHIANIRDRGRD